MPRSARPLMTGASPPSTRPEATRRNSACFHATDGAGVLPATFGLVHELQNALASRAAPYSRNRWSWASGCWSAVLARAWKAGPSGLGMIGPPAPLGCAPRLQGAPTDGGAQGRVAAMTPSASGIGDVGAFSRFGIAAVHRTRVTVVAGLGDDVHIDAASGRGIPGIGRTEVVIVARNHRVQVQA